ncbi:hypothetical protein C1701_17270 [Actinoalloteichus sp. AHMU CJ021]|uniref:hypothetical protein n=1 Tax=Actinoalloteichus sp. AHMU CJ021 TaxID=2072503 RepID=UPI000CA08492|nr:hypothetical protein C1701_17270 [Actinoalloteichus sp. AHMU CJ021]
MIRPAADENLPMRWAGADHPVPGSDLAGLLARQAGRTPEAAAVLTDTGAVMGVTVLLIWPIAIRFFRWE